MGKVIDFLPFPEEQNLIAFAIQNVGLVFQHFDNGDSFEVESFQEDCLKDVVSTYFNESNIVGMHYNDYLPGYMFAIISIPPAVLEYNITDPLNIFMFKYYGVLNGCDRFIGMNVISANYNKVVHLLVDVITYQ